MSQHVHVVGAGFAGLTISLRLAQKGFSVDLYEKSERVGGLIGTEITPYGVAERAANALIRTYPAEKFFAELGLTPVVPLQESKKRFIYRERPRRWPLSLSESLQLILRFLPKFIFNKAALRPQPLETLHTWGEKNLGSAATKYLLGPAMQGIYASGAEALSSELILGPLFRRKKKSGAHRGLLTGPNGMQDVINALEAKVRTLGVRIHLNTEVDLSTLQGPVVVATSCSAAAKILAQESPELSSLLGRIPMASVLSAKMFFKKPQDRYKGFGCLIPRVYGMKTLGVLMNSYIFPNRDQTYNETWILGGSNAGDIHDASDAEILQVIAEERFKILGTKETLIDYRLHRWKNTLPLYNLELEKTLQDLKALPQRRIYLHGNYLGGIGLSKILDRSEELAQEISRHG